METRDNRPKSLLLVVVMLLVLVANAASAAQVNGLLRQVGTQSILSVWGTNYEMGYAHGYLLADKIRDLVANYQIPVVASGSVTKYNALINQNSNLYIWQQPYLDEVNGIAAGMVASGKNLYVSKLRRNIDARDIKVINEQDQLYFGCSALGVWGNATENGETILAKNFDFPYDTQGTAINTQLIITYQPSAGGKFFSVAWPGMVGTYSGMNQDGITVIDNKGNGDNATSGPYHPIAETGRYLVEATTPTSFPTLPLSYVNSIFDLTSEIYILGLPNQGTADPAYVIEDSATLNMIRYGSYSDPGYDHIIATNHFLEVLPPPTSGNSLDRYNTIRNSLLNLYATGNGKVNSRQAWAIMDQVANIVAPTLNTMVVRPNRMEFDLSFATLKKSVFTSSTKIAPQTYTFASVFPDPVAGNDTYSTPLNTTLTVAAPGVLANDSNPRGTALKAQLATSPSHGSLTLNESGAFSYIPATSFTGADSFTYTATDGTYTSSPATVTITVASQLALGSLTLTTSSLVGGNTTQGTVTLTGPAPASGATVSLSDDSAAVGVPASVLVPSGSTSASFTITTTTVSASTTATISATYGGVTRTAPLTVTASGLGSISGTVSPAPSGSGTTLTLSQSGTTVATVTAKSDGTYSFSSVAAGSYLVTPAKAGFSFTPASAAVNVNGSNITGLNFTALGLAIDVNISTDRMTFSPTLATPAFSTAAGNELLLAFVASDANGSVPNVTVTGVSGGGLSWTLVRRTNTQQGTAEIWRAFAGSKLTNATVTATLSQSVAASITVVSFAGVNTAAPVGAVGGASASTGAPTASLTTQAANSWVFGVGNDWDGAVARTPGANQSIVHQYLVTNTTNNIYGTLWVQRQAPTVQPANTVVTISDTAPTNHRWNLSVVEIRQN